MLCAPSNLVTADGCGLLFAGHPAALPRKVYGGGTADRLRDRHAGQDGLDESGPKETHSSGGVYQRWLGSHECRVGEEPLIGLVFTS